MPHMVATPCKLSHRLGRRTMKVSVSLALVATVLSVAYAFASAEDELVSIATSDSAHTSICPGCSMNRVDHVHTYGYHGYRSVTEDNDAAVQTNVTSVTNEYSCNGPRVYPAGTIKFEQQQHENRTISGTATVQGQYQVEAEASYSIVKAKVGITAGFSLSGTYAVEQGNTIGSTFTSPEFTLNPHKTYEVTMTIRGTKATATHYEQRVDFCDMGDHLPCTVRNVYASDCWQTINGSTKTYEGTKGTSVNYTERTY